MNPNKATIILIIKRSKLNILHLLEMRGAILEFSEEVKHLRVIAGKNLISKKRVESWPNTRRFSTLGGQK